MTIAIVKTGHIYAITHGLELSTNLLSAICTGNAMDRRFLRMWVGRLTRLMYPRAPQTPPMSNSMPQASMPPLESAGEQMMEVGIPQRKCPRQDRRGRFMSLICLVRRLCSFPVSLLTLITERETRLINPVAGCTNANVTLVRHGLLGCSPENPSVAITFRTLRCFRQCHRVCPRLSRQAFIRALCHLHDVPYHPYLVDQFTIAFDVYLDIMYKIQEQCNKALQRDTENWRMKNVCPPCTYKLEGEPNLGFSILCSIDGNSSLKLVGDEVRAGSFLKDERVGRTDLFLSREEVDEFIGNGVSSMRRFSNYG